MCVWCGGGAGGGAGWMRCVTAAVTTATFSYILMTYKDLYDYDLMNFKERYNIK